MFGMGGFGWGFLLLSFCIKLTAVRILAPHQRAPRNPTQLKHSSQPNSQKYYLPIYFFLNIPHNKTTHKSLSHPATQSKIIQIMMFAQNSRLARAPEFISRTSRNISQNCFCTASMEFLPSFLLYSPSSLTSFPRSSETSVFLHFINVYVLINSFKTHLEKSLIYKKRPKIKIVIKLRAKHHITIIFPSVLVRSLKNIQTFNFFFKRSEQNDTFLLPALHFLRKTNNNQTKKSQTNKEKKRKQKTSQIFFFSKKTLFKIIHCPSIVWALFPLSYSN